MWEKLNIKLALKNNIKNSYNLLDQLLEMGNSPLSKKIVEKRIESLMTDIEILEDTLNQY